MSKKKITLACNECKSKNYRVAKSNTENRIEVNKFCSRCSKHSLHKEEK